MRLAAAEALAVGERGWVANAPRRSDQHCQGAGIRVVDLLVPFVTSNFNRRSCMSKRLIVKVTAGLALLVAGLVGWSALPAQASAPPPIAGAWYYDAIGAPFPAHTMVIDESLTVVSSNPDRGEANNSASSGMGACVPGGGGTWRCEFVEVNADPTTHAHTSNLIVIFTVTMNGSNAFTAPAQVFLYAPDGTLIEDLGTATLYGQRILVDGPAPIAHS
jgi:hypothetical protein